MSHTNHRVMSHTGATRVHILAAHQPSDVTHTNESCHTQITESCQHTGATRVHIPTAHQPSDNTHTNESCHTQITESCHTQELRECTFQPRINNAPAYIKKIATSQKRKKEAQLLLQRHEVCVNTKNTNFAKEPWFVCKRALCTLPPNPHKKDALPTLQRA